MAFRARVLVVDDDRNIAETLAALLRLHEFDARPAYSGKSAIQMAGKFEPEVLITDVVMPGMNGVEAASHIRSLFPQCKILLITGRSAAADLVLKTHALNDGFELLAKPVHPRDILARL
jgi:DNA-binding response OmpR family regulator